MSDERLQLAPEVEQRLACDLFGACWDLLEQPDRTPVEDDAMLHLAHASRHHWGQVGQPENLARGEWQCSRVYAVLGRAEPAFWHANRCLALCREHGLVDWDLAAAWEAMARAAMIAKDGPACREYVAAARASLDAIAEADDRAVIEADLATIQPPS